MKRVLLCYQLFRTRPFFVAGFLFLTALLLPTTPPALAGKYSAFARSTVMPCTTVLPLLAHRYCYALRSKRSSRGESTVFRQRKVINNSDAAGVHLCPCAGLSSITRVRVSCACDMDGNVRAGLLRFKIHFKMANTAFFLQVSNIVFIFVKQSFFDVFPPLYLILFSAERPSPTLLNSLIISELSLLC